VGHIAVVVALAAAAFGARPASAQDENAARGQKIAQEKCARCHAIGRSDTSPDPKAPPFRRIGKGYPLEHLGEALAEGIVTGDNAMPEFKFNPRDIDAILDYMAELGANK
jgi:mono/diheme cytochrome c family protein